MGRRALLVGDLHCAALCRFTSISWRISDGVDQQWAGCPASRCGVDAAEVADGNEIAARRRRYFPVSIPMASQVPWDMVVAIEFYGDESGDASDRNIKTFSVAGFLATVNDWGRFNDLWNRDVLKENNVPYVHMREFDQFIGPFERFKNDKPATVGLLQAITTVIHTVKLRGAGAAIILSELSEYNSTNSLALDPYGLCLYLTFANINMTYWNALRGCPFQMILDRAPNGHKRAAAFIELLETDAAFQLQVKNGLVKVPVVIPLPESSPGSREIPALQAADFLAWEFSRAVNLKMKWFLEIKPNLPDQSQQTIDRSLIEFQAREKKVESVNQDNYWSTRERRSFANLLMHQKGNYRVLDRHTLGLLAGYRERDWPRKT